MDFPRIPHIFHSPSLAKTWITRAPRNSSHLVVVHPQLVGKAFQMNHTCWRDVLSRDDPMTSDDPTQRDFQEPNMENPLRNRKSCFFWHFIAGKDLEQHHLKNTVSARCWRQAATWRLVQLNFGSNSILGLLDPITSFNLQIFADLPWSAHTPFQYLPISSNIYFPIIYISSNNFQYLLIYIPYIYISSNIFQNHSITINAPTFISVLGDGWYNGCSEAAQFSDKSPIARSQKNLSSPVSERDWKSGLTPHLWPLW